MQQFAVLFLGLVGLASASNYTDCSTNYTTLERALLHTGNNAYNIWTAFYPPQDAAALFVNVEYEFQDESGSLDARNESLHYIWSSAAFYLIQPPQVFGYTSLFFGFVQSSLIQDVILILPYECKDIEFKKNNDDSKNNLLEVLTHRLKLYAQRRPAGIVTVSSSYQAKAVEDSHALEHIYNDGKVVGLFISLIFVTPFFFYLFILVFVKGARLQIREQLSSDSPGTHASLAALVVVGLLFSLFVVIMDGAALYFAQHKNELTASGQNDHHSNNIPLVSDGVLVTTLFFDTVITLAALIGYFFLLTTECTCCSKDKWCCFNFYPSTTNFFRFWSSAIFCCFTMHKKHTDDNKKRNWNEQKLWLFMLLLFAPLWCLGTHTGYIIVAWISFPAHATAISLMYIMSFFYYFVTFRQFYLCLVDCERLKACCGCRCCKKSACCTDDELGLPDDEKEAYETRDNKSFRLWIIFFETGIAFVLCGFQIWVIFGLVSLPFIDVIHDAPTYVYSFSTTIFVIVAGLITYKFLVVNKAPPQA